MSGTQLVYGDGWQDIKVSKGQAKSFYVYVTYKEDLGSLLHFNKI